MATAAREFEGRSVSLGRIFSRAFNAMGGSPAVVFGSALLFGALPSILGNALFNSLRNNGHYGAMMLVTAANFFLSMLTIALVQGIVVSATLAESEGRKATFGECIARAFGQVLPIVVISIASGFAIMLGLLILVVPGIILATMWAVPVPVAVAERSGIGGAFSRSSALTKGARWKIFGLFLVLFVIVMLITWLGTVINLTIGLTPDEVAGLSPVGVAVNTVIGTVSTAIWATISASLYVELRDWKDGPVTAALGDIFG